MHAKKKSIASDLKRLDKITESEIDYSDIPPLDESFFTKATFELPKNKISITLRLDSEVLEFFRGQGKGYQTLINAILKTYMFAHKSKFKLRRS
ncbi:MAG TPA: BrnA antitoxin family protein [Coxiellaceae bacterium]|nr:BrnA antitoxin family protein [Coxiellaceae bacterium]